MKKIILNKYQRKINTLNNDIEILQEIIKNKLYDNFMDIINIKEENKTLKEKNKQLKEKIKALKNGKEK